MNLDFVVKLLEENGNFTVAGKCIDCDKDVNVSVELIGENQIKISGGALYQPPESYRYQEKIVCKCDDCFKLDSQIHQRNEVYTRVVGYLRPTSQMNPGKVAEINQRAMFNIQGI
jgi:hypothetical protein